MPGARPAGVGPRRTIGLAPACPAKDQKWLWTALATGDAKLVEANDPGSKFDWNCTSPTYGTPLMAATFGGDWDSSPDFMLDNAAAFESRLRLIRWLIREKGADPKKEASAAFRTTKTWYIDVGGDSNSVTVDLHGESALSAMLIVKIAMQTADGDWSEDIERLRQVVDVFATTRSRQTLQKRNTVSLHEGVVDTWERFMETGPGKDLTIRCMTGPSVQGTLLVHSGILTSASAVVRAMLSGPMRESASMAIDVDCPVDALQLFMSLVYTGSISTESDAPIAVDMLLGCMQIAQRWDVRHVVQMMVSQLSTSMSIETLGQVWEAAALTQQQELLAECRNFARNDITQVRSLLAAKRFCRVVEQDLFEHVLPEAMQVGAGASSKEAGGSPASKRRRTFS